MATILDSAEWVEDVDQRFVDEGISALRLGDGSFLAFQVPPWEQAVEWWGAGATLDESLTEAPISADDDH